MAARLNKQVRIDPVGMGRIQAKLKIGRPGDQFEQQADRVSETVMQTEPQANGEGENPQTRRPVGGSTETTSAEALHSEAIGGSGKPLAQSARTFMETRFGHDFSRVRIHSDSRAAAVAEEMNANAFTLGHNIVFGAGNYAPETSNGLRLLAHELTHVLQQTGGEMEEMAGARLSPYHSDPIVMRQARLEGVDPATQRQFETLLHEQEVAVQDVAPTNPADLAIWTRYNNIFAAAQAFADQVATQVEPHTHISGAFPIAATDGSTLLTTFDSDAPTLIRELLGGGRAPTAGTTAARQRTAAQTADVFGPFQGHWQGFWQQSGTTTEYEHNWQPTVPARRGSHVFAQPVSMGRPPLGRTRTPAINVVQRDTGTITGAVGVSGGSSERPHVGFYAGPGKLLWVALETSGTPTRPRYSVFFEISSGGIYTIKGVDFTWDTTVTPPAVVDLKTKGGSYTKRP